MKVFQLLIFSIFSLLKTFDASKMILIYFTRTGNTGLFADYIKEKLNIKTYQIIPVVPYPNILDEVLELAKIERINNTRPEIKDPLKDINEYDIILLGYPIWHQNLPSIVINQIEQLNWNGKIIYPFNTYGSLGVANSTNDIKNFAKGAVVKEGFPISDNMIKIKNESMIEIEKWINENFENHEELLGDDKELTDNYKMININLLILIMLLIIFI